MSFYRFLCLGFYGLRLCTRYPRRTLDPFEMFWGIQDCLDIPYTYSTNLFLTTYEKDLLGQITATTTPLNTVHECQWSMETQPTYNPETLNPVDIAVLFFLM